VSEINNHKDALKALYNDFQHLEPSEHAARAALASAIAQLERIISDEIGEEVEDHSGLIEQLNEAALHLEAEHPTVAAAIRTAVNILTQLGL